MFFSFYWRTHSFWHERWSQTVFKKAKRESVFYEALNVIKPMWHYRALGFSVLPNQRRWLTGRVKVLQLPVLQTPCRSWELLWFFRSSPSRRAKQPQVGLCPSMMCAAALPARAEGHRMWPPWAGSRRGSIAAPGLVRLAKKCLKGLNVENGRDESQFRNWQ